VEKVDNEAYRYELARVAKNLGLPIRRDTESVIIEHCRAQMDEWVKLNGKPKTLTELMDLFASSLDMEFFEVHHDEDLESLFKRIPIRREPVLARLLSELDDSTDALTIRRNKCEAWERRFLAVVNCKGRHSKRAFFSKWHELTHRILDGQQLRMAFRKTKVNRPEPEEVLVDRVAAKLAYYPEIFKPIVTQELTATGTITFDGVDRIREEIAPEASLQSTAIACFPYCRRAVSFIICSLGYKRELEKKMANNQSSMFALPEPELRVKETGSSQAMTDCGIRFYSNMRVPESSPVFKAFNDPFSQIQQGTERLENWQTSTGGPIGYGELNVEAFRLDDEVWALLTLNE
jgi:hypothetical protein